MIIDYLTFFITVFSKTSKNHLENKREFGKIIMIEHTRKERTQ